MCRSMLFPDKNKGSGFTMIEMLIAMGLITVVMAGVLTLFTTANQSYVKQGQVVSTEQNVRSSMEIMAHEIRMAGYIPEANMPGGSAPIATGVTGAPLQRIVSAAANDLTFVADTMGTGTAQTIRYWLSGTTLQRQVWQYSGGWTGPTTDMVADNITALTFSYTLSTGPPAISNPTGANLSLIREITMTVTGQTKIPFETKTGPQYIPRTLSSNLKLRNMGLDTTVP